MILKIIYLFLDLDGVFNGNYQFQTSRDLFKFDHVQLSSLGLKQNPGDYMSIYRLNVFRNLTKKYGIRIVGTSSCFAQFEGKSNVQDYAKALDLNIVDIGHTGGGVHRGKGVLEYIKNNGVEHFIIVDDSRRFYDPSEFSEYEKFCIFPCGRFGLTDYNFECLEVIIKNILDDTNKTPYTYTTKMCYNCGSTKMILLRSYNYKECAECGTQVEWPLDEGQKPLK